MASPGDHLKHTQVICVYNLVVKKNRAHVLTQTYLENIMPSHKDHIVYDPTYMKC